MKFVQQPSIVNKLIMSISGLFLILFLTVHISMNLVAVFSLSAYDDVCEYMGTNPFVRIMVPVLALGFMVHIVYAFYLSWQNRKAREDQRYAENNKTDITWASKNMLALGVIVLGILFIHLSHFWAKMQLMEWAGEEPVKGSVLIVEVFSNPLNVLIYLVWILALCFHLIHGFWSALQSVGLNNNKWGLSIKIICHSYVTLIIGGFMTTVIYFYLRSILIIIK